MMDKIYYTLNDVHNDSDHLYHMVSDSHWIPDVIVGVARGGLVPAVMLSHSLNIPLATVHWSYRDFTTREDLISKIGLSTQRILIVDDICDSGETLTTLVKRIQDTSSTQPQIRTAVLFYNVAQSFRVNYYANPIDRTVDKRWVLFPWEK